MLRLAAAFVLAASPLAATEITNDITAARYIEPTDVYGHGAVAGGEYARMRVTLSDGTERNVSFKKSIFEDTAPRLHDFDGDGSPEIVTVVSGFATGAWVQVWSLNASGALIPAKSNAPIGARHRWLAVVGIADFDGDGTDDIAYIDRPHLAKELVILPVDLAGSGMLDTTARLAGLTNHHFGSAEIEGGMRDCSGQVPAIVTANADWSQVMETRFEDGQLATKPVAPYTGADSFAPFLICP
ncbi:Repeat domain-containing protein [Celeribacter baekdonensis]|uniref:Repeat domain-containing protein n=1 Tax=Celeribacter baekdonensis TaxID=875171 RepID=A0A1G7I423_9RHOB|nr:VCBS repeat-containing protein [Celeribacter baekdonensis]SDF07537.1 Repeat domain-containing protein [Celeribacter baekdonensis]